MRAEYSLTLEKNEQEGVLKFKRKFFKGSQGIIPLKIIPKRLEKVNEIFLEYSRRIEDFKKYAREMVCYEARLASFK